MDSSNKKHFSKIREIKITTYNLKCYEGNPQWFNESKYWDIRDKKEHLLFIIYNLFKTIIYKCEQQVMFKTEN